MPCAPPHRLQFRHTWPTSHRGHRSRHIRTQGRANDIEYDNDTGPGDEYFVEWFNVTNGEKSFRCNTKEDAEFLLASLSSPGSGWVKVEDGLPEIPPPYFENGLKLTPLGCRVIVYDSVSKEVYEAKYYDGHFDDNNPDITHWQPLPTPPGVEDNQTKKQ